MWRIVFLLAVTLHHSHAAPQFVSLKDGKVGVNFGGYHAEAGLGGLLTGNVAHGGLSASAGTPFGQQAGAGLGGLVNGRAAGSAFAGATAGGNVGASAGLGGIAGGEDTDSGLGAEAHVGGTSHSVVSSAGGGLEITKQVAKVAQPAIEFEGQGDFYVSGAAGAPSANVNLEQESTAIQKIKSPKKYAVEAAPTNVVPVVEKRKQVVVQAAPAPAPVPAVRSGYAGSFQGSVDTGTFFDSIFNIPIATLKAVNGLLNTKVQAGGGLEVQKSASLHLG